MKLTVILSIKESYNRIAQLLDQAGIKRFSTVHIIGYKNDKSSHLMNWFGEKSDSAKTNSILFFCFTTEKESISVLEEINRCNAQSGKKFPAHAFVMDVEKHSILL
ncbi:MAG: hypothetical protein LKF48_08445 [Prevotella sp.]|jgi:nitrogen regulatory protein PII|nr:hypothetical protein [Prevotella sp.]MCH4183167.1 hypothetical protein [Prevotella sp.]MCH4212711.1 hypothetical protein [Prevotella sp.]MCH4241756.1 hypothetical protein [Prevotella sp.]MCI1742257.1 hypothetical protein [Prevotella sp.]